MYTFVLHCLVQRYQLSLISYLNEYIFKVFSLSSEMYTTYLSYLYRLRFRNNLFFLFSFHSDNFQIVIVLYYAGE